MCGILGIKINTSFEEFDKSRIKNGLHQIHHRGPDYSDYKYFDPWIFGHTRLSIIDTTDAGHQPMSDPNSDCSIIFNGEIYNYADLKNDLLSKGYTFQSQSDTEVLLYHLKENGIQGIQQLNGCFAFAFYDSKKKTVILARDPMGINPLFYRQTENSFCFGSSIKSIATLSDEKVIWSDSLNQYFKFGYIPGNKTLFKDIQEVAPGEVLVIDDTLKVDKHQIKPVTQNYTVDTHNDIKKAVFETLENAVIKRLRADVPLGCFLSGGLDSSIISALAFRHQTDVNTFSIGIGDQEYYDESKYAEEVAQHIGTAHQTIRITESDFQERYDDIMDAFEFPFADASAINLFFLSEATRKHVTVALSGDGADELFGGYRKHIAYQNTKVKSIKNSAIKWLSPLTKVSKGNRDSKLSDTIRKIQKYSALQSLPESQKADFLASFGLESFIRELTDQSIVSSLFQKEEVTHLNQLLLSDQRLVLPGDMLTKVDMMSMHHSLEVRTPFLDPEVVNLANRLPEKYKTNTSTGKLILREVFKDLLPQTVFNRPKKGFEAPLHQWIFNRLDELKKKEFFQKGYIEHQNIFTSSTVLQLIQDFEKNAYPEVQFHFWAYLVFQEWYSRNKQIIDA